jgi:SAM-dependent methyltransferase
MTASLSEKPKAKFDVLRNTPVISVIAAWTYKLICLPYRFYKLQNDFSDRAAWIDKTAERLSSRLAASEAIISRVNQIETSLRNLADKQKEIEREIKHGFASGSQSHLLNETISSDFTAAGTELAVTVPESGTGTSEYFTNGQGRLVYTKQNYYLERLLEVYQFSGGQILDLSTDYVEKGSSVVCADNSDITIVSVQDLSGEIVTTHMSTALTFKASHINNQQIPEKLNGHSSGISAPGKSENQSLKTDILNSLQKEFDNIHSRINSFIDYEQKWSQLEGNLRASLELRQGTVANRLEEINAEIAQMFSLFQITDRLESRIDNISNSLSGEITRHQNHENYISQTILSLQGQLGKVSDSLEKISAQVAETATLASQVERQASEIHNISEAAEKIEYLMYKTKALTISSFETDSLKAQIRWMSQRLTEIISLKHDLSLLQNWRESFFNQSLLTEKQQPSLQKPRQTQEIREEAIEAVSDVKVTNFLEIPAIESFQTVERARQDSGLWFSDPVVVGFNDEQEIYWAATTERIVEKGFVFQALARIAETSEITLLDVGSAESLLPCELASLGYKVTAIDIRPLKISHPYLQIIQEDICQTTLATESFDAAIALSTLEHIGLGWYGDRQGEDLDRIAVRQILRCLKPKGKFIATVPYGKKAMTPVHRIYDKKGLQQLLQDLQIDRIVYGIRRDPLTLTVTEDESIAAQKIHNPDSFLPGAVAMVIGHKV